MSAGIFISGIDGPGYGLDSIDGHLCPLSLPPVVRSDLIIYGLDDGCRHQYYQCDAQIAAKDMKSVHIESYELAQ